MAGPVPLLGLWILFKNGCIILFEIGLILHVDSFVVEKILGVGEWG